MNPNKPQDSSANALQQQMLTQLSDPQLLQQASAYAGDFVKSMRERPAFPPADALQALQGFHEPMPAEPCPAGQVLDMLQQIGGPAVVPYGSGRYFGFVNGGVLPAPLAVKVLADAWDQNAGLYLTSPLAAELEQVCEDWLVDLLRLPKGTAAGLVTGSATATLCGLTAARHALLARQGWDVNAKGLYEAPRLRVVMGGQAHVTVSKALAVLGLGTEAVEIMPTDPDGRMMFDDAPILDENCIVIAQAGNVNSGAFDEFVEIIEKTRAAGAWLHIDGAFGLWAAASDQYRHLLHGAEWADSWAVDAHKTLNAPYDCGIILCRDRAALTNALRTNAAYIQSTGQRDNMHYTLDMSRRARSLELWAALKSLGKSGVQDLVNRLCHHAYALATGLHQQGFRILNRVTFNQVLVAGNSPEQTQAILAQVQQSGECWCGGTSWYGKPAIRLSVCSWTTTEADLDRTVQAFVAARSAVRT